MVVIKVIFLEDRLCIFIIPFGYESRASFAFPPSPQLSDSPGRHRCPFPIKGSQFASTSLMSSNDPMGMNAFLSKTFFILITLWDSGWETNTVCFCSNSCLKVQWARWNRYDTWLELKYDSQMSIMQKISLWDSGSLRAIYNLIFCNQCLILFYRMCVTPFIFIWILQYFA